MPDEEVATVFINFVFFCTPSSIPLTFRLSEKEDYLNSYLREHVLQNLPQREVNQALIRRNVTSEKEGDWVLTDERNQLEEWQKTGALEHWTLMRTIMPDFFWETY